MYLLKIEEAALVFAAAATALPRLRVVLLNDAVGDVRGIESSLGSSHGFVNLRCDASFLLLQNANGVAFLDRRPRLHQRGRRGMFFRRAAARIGQGLAFGWAYLLRPVDGLVACLHVGRSVLLLSRGVTALDDEARQLVDY